jgi:hypothetical protein
VPDFTVFGQGKRDQQPKPAGPSPELVATWATLHQDERHKLEFVAYLVMTHRLGRGDMEAAR